MSYTNMHDTHPGVVFGSGGTAAGTVDNPGSGDWSISRSSAGVYVVSFAQPFRTPPSVTASPQRNSGTSNVTVVITGEPTVNGFTVTILIGAVATDLVFAFIAMSNN